MGKRDDEIQAFLGKGTEFQGQLKFEGTVRIDGIFRGEVQATGTLVVGEGAKVEAEMRCGTLIVSGELMGNIHATHRVEALAPARIMGNIQTPVLVISEGVLFDGNARMGGAGEEAVDRERKLSLLGKREKKPQTEEVNEAESS